MKINQLPKVAVLLAAYNGEKYIQEQIESILNQVDVDVYIYISIDTSTDRTLEICQQLQKIYKNIFIINEGKERFGSAGKNFYYLIKNVDFEEFDFIALSDQDDIWKPAKIIRGIQVLEKENAFGYSSDVECFWDDSSRKNKIIKKSYPQQKYDHYFEPAGPGCTYILRVNLAIFLKNRICTLPKLPFHHDWFIYASARDNEFPWFIDTDIHILYRQHNNNQVGANISISQKIKRLKKLRNQGFQREVIEVIDCLKNKHKIRMDLARKIIKNPFLYRRKKIEAIYLLIFCLIGWIKL